MVRNALRREPKAQEFVELRVMETQGEPVRESAFELREGIEMVPGTVHLVDSEFSTTRAGREMCMEGLGRSFVPTSDDPASLLLCGPNTDIS
jgi:hypothetical protein